MADNEHSTLRVTPRDKMNYNAGKRDGIQSAINVIMAEQTKEMYENRANWLQGMKDRAAAIQLMDKLMLDLHRLRSRISMAEELPKEGE